MSRIKIIVTLLLAIVTQISWAQGRVISGTVEDSMGPVMMANVVEQDGNNRIVNHTQTDMMGNFSMEIKSPKNKLVISYVGSKTQVITIGDKETFAIKLEDEKTTLSEVTVKGRRANSGGLNIDKKEISVSQQTFNLADVEGMAFTSADEALQGEIAGLDIVSNSGNLGAGTTMRLRGVSTISGSSEPLLVVDDKIFDTPDDFDFENADEEKFSSLLSVNVEDIASITVLKDAAATAIWGSQGANGVIQITTKRGKRGKPRVNFSYKFTGVWLPKGYTLLNGDQYTMMLKEELYNPSQSAAATATIKEINYDPNWADYQNWNNNTDWLKEVTQFGPQHEYNFNITGGGEKATFRISAGYNTQQNYIIKQKYDRLTSRLVLDYNVSDRIRFSTNFAFTYSDNLKNNTTGSSMGNDNIIGMALNMAPNMSVYRQDRDGNDTGDYMIMNPVVGKGSNSYYTPAEGNYTSKALEDVRKIGNPVAYANLAWKRQKIYQITPDFNLRYELLGTGNGQHRLTFDGRVYFDVYAQSTPTYLPGSLMSTTWNEDKYNQSTNTETNQLKIGARTRLTFTPHFKNEDFYLTMFGQYELLTTKYNSQYVMEYELPNGIESSNVTGALGSLTSTNSRSATHNWLFNSHFSYKGRYSLGFSLRADGNSKFGPEKPWFYSPSVSLRYNVSDEKFFEPLKKVVSMFGIRASWGITGSSSAKDYSFFNNYSANGTYGKVGNLQQAMLLSGLKLDELIPQKKVGYNLGFNFGFLNDMFEVDLNLYNETTKDLQMSNITIPSIVGYSSLATGNIGKMRNKGWDLSFSANKFVKINKFSVSANFNIAQNQNELLEMDERVLRSLNGNDEYTYTNRGGDSRMNRVQVGNALCSIYGYQYKGVYQYSYQWLVNQQKENAWDAATYEAHINQWLAEGKTFPVATDANGRVIMNSNGTPQRMVYNYELSSDGATGTTLYSFDGGDAIYEDINHDGQIDKFDIVYLGNSLPKLQGGFNLTFNYGNWKLIARFTYRWGNKLFNQARMNLEQMYTTSNQAASVNSRWRKDGDETVIPRALYGMGYNYQASSRYVEDGSFLRFQNIQVSYSFPKKMIKKWGLQSLSAYVTMNRLFCWTKYSGIDPEIAASTYAPAIDKATSPVSRSVTAAISVGF